MLPTQRPLNTQRSNAAFLYPPLPHSFLHTFIAVGATITVFGLYVAETLDIVIGAALAAMVMLLTGCLSVEQARRAIRWEIVLVIAASLGVSTGMEQSGASGALMDRKLLCLCCPAPLRPARCRKLRSRPGRLTAAALLARPGGPRPDVQSSSPPCSPLPCRAAAIANGLVSGGRAIGSKAFVIIGEPSAGWRGRLAKAGRLAGVATMLGLSADGQETSISLANCLF